MWLGAVRDNTTENSQTSFYWSDGTAWDYHQWMGGNPDNYNDEEDCVNDYGEYGWNDNSCDSEIPYVCKKGISELVTVGGGSCVLNPISRCGG